MTDNEFGPTPSPKVAFSPLIRTSMPAPPPREDAGNSPKSNSISTFGLTSDPFGHAGVSGAVPMTAYAQGALDRLKWGVRERKGLMLLVGEVGTGKTTVINQLRAWLAENATPAAHLFNPMLDTPNFFDFVLNEFGIRQGPESSGTAFARLTNWLFARHRDGKTVTLIVDESQGLSVPVLQAIGLLLNLEASGEKLLQVVLAGQPELSDKLRMPELRPIHQRIALRCRTAALSIQETHAYIEQRLRAAGADASPIFSEEAVDSIQLYSRGIPRVINLLCEHGLANACTHQIRPVPTCMIEDVAREFQLDELRPLGPSSTGANSSNANLLVMPGDHPSLIRASSKGHRAGVAANAALSDDSQTVDTLQDSAILLNIPENTQPLLGGAQAAPAPQVVRGLSRSAPPIAAPRPASVLPKDVQARPASPAAVRLRFWVPLRNRKWGIVDSAWRQLASFVNAYRRIAARIPETFRQSPGFEALFALSKRRSRRMPRFRRSWSARMEPLIESFLQSSRAFARRIGPRDEWLSDLHALAARIKPREELFRPLGAFGANQVRIVRMAIAHFHQLPPGHSLREWPRNFSLAAISHDCRQAFASLIRWLNSPMHTVRLPRTPSSRHV
jgi:general secretion pathway protein A